MSDNSSEPASRQQQFGDILATLMRAADLGESVDPDDWYVRHPDFKVELQGFFAQQKRMEKLVRPLRQDTTDAGRIDQDAMEGENEPEPQHLGRYQIRRVLGRGGMGIVYMAYDPKLDRPVALKVPRRSQFQSPEQVAKFIEEARTAANLKHPLLVAVYDIQKQDGVPYIVQEFIEGPNLGQWAAEHNRSFEQIARVLVSVAEALGYAHQQGLTHCDLKLANVLIDNADQPHVADFGLAVRESALELRKGEIFGTPAMMAPEQVQGESHWFDGRTDIWAIGAMLYELLVGRRPFTSSQH